MVEVNDQCFTVRLDKNIEEMNTNWAYKRIKPSATGNGLNYVSIGREWSKVKVSSKILEGELIDKNNLERTVEKLNGSNIVEFKMESLLDCGTVEMIHIAKDSIFRNVSKTLDSLKLLQLNKEWDITNHYGNKNLSFVPKGRDKRQRPEGNIYDKYLESRNHRFKNTLRTEFKAKGKRKIIKLLEIPDNTVQSVFNGRGERLHEMLINAFKTSILINPNMELKPETQLTFKCIWEVCENDLAKVFDYFKTFYQSRSTIKRKRKEFQSWLSSEYRNQIPEIEQYLESLKP